MEWIRGDKIGFGSFATVSLAIPTTQNPQLMAVKSCGASHSVSLMNEKVVLDELKDCPQVIQCFGDCFSFEKGERLYNLVLEYANGGSISDKIKKRSSCGFQEFEVRSYTNSILKGLDFIHKNGFVHCDIKLQNVLLFEINGIETAKIADFGLAKKSGIKIGELGLELRGTPLYMSPEMVNSGEQESAADIWALGCIVLEMITGESAWRLSEKSDMCGLMMRIGVGQELPEIPSCLSAEGKDFLGKCFTKNPNQRWTAEMLLNHPFLANLENDHLSISSKDTPSISPRSAFDFPDCSTPHSSMTYSPENPPAIRLQKLVTDQNHNWVNCLENWIAVR